MPIGKLIDPLGIEMVNSQKDEETENGQLYN